MATESRLRFMTVSRLGAEDTPQERVRLPESPGAKVRLEGRRSGDTFFVERSATLSAPDASFAESLPSDAKRYQGKLEFLHADDFDRGTCDLVYSLKNEDGDQIPVRFPVAPEILEDPTVFVPDEAFGRLEGAKDVSTDPLRVEIWEEFVSSVGG